jgi:dienelactone hydrolase
MLDPLWRRSGDGMDEFKEFPFEHGGIEHRVFRHGAGPAVVLLHEIPGMSPATIDLGRRLAGAGFSAYLPLFYGRPGRTSMAGGAVRLFCLRREFTLLTLDRSSPVADWVRALCRKAHKDVGGPGVGVVGMCMSGGIALAATIEPKVRAAVSSQPALPSAFPPTRRRQANLGMSPEELRKAVDSGTPVLAVRFRHDPISPARRAQAICEAFGSSAEYREVPTPDEGDYRDARPPIRRLAHSVIAFDFVDCEGHPTRSAMDDVLGFLRRNLLEQPG